MHSQRKPKKSPRKYVAINLDKAPVLLTERGIATLPLHDASRKPLVERFFAALNRKLVAAGRKKNTSR